MASLTLIASVFAATGVGSCIASWVITLNWLEKHGRWEQTRHAARDGSWDRLGELGRNPPDPGCGACLSGWERHVASCPVCQRARQRGAIPAHPDALRPHRRWHAGRW